MPEMPGTLGAACRGAAAGVAATAAMSVVMLGAQRNGLVPEPPPELLVDRTLDAAGVQADEKTTNAAATVSHFAFGAAAGALFGVLRRHLPWPPPWPGLAYGTAVAAASYQGWIPAAGLLPPLDDQSPGLRRTVVLSHLVYGATLDAAHRFMAE
jgi:uncharacterized membrane protein YagU involved in acid resistance